MSARELFWDSICAFRQLLLIGIILDCIFLGVTLTMVPLMIAGGVSRATAVITVVNVVLGAGILLSMGYAYRRCGNRRTLAE
jgi:uncharacterized membrane protein YfcA